MVGNSHIFMAVASQETSGECRTINCPQSADKDGYCLGCWASIFVVVGGGQ